MKMLFLALFCLSKVTLAGASNQGLPRLPDAAVQMGEVMESAEMLPDKDNYYLKEKQIVKLIRVPGSRDRYWLAKYQEPLDDSMPRDRRYPFYYASVDVDNSDGKSSPTIYTARTFSLMIAGGKIERLWDSSFYLQDNRGSNPSDIWSPQGDWDLHVFGDGYTSSKIFKGDLEDRREDGRIVS